MSKRPAQLKTILIMAVAIIAMAVPLMFLLEDFVRDAIVAPAAYLVWLLSVIVDALPHTFLLGFATALVAYIAARSLIREQAAPKLRKVQHTPPEGNAAGWLHRLQLVAKGSYSQQRLEHHVGQLLLQVIAYENRISVREASRLFELGQIELEPELSAFLDAALSRRLPSSPNLFGRLKALLRGNRTSKTTARDVRVSLEPPLSFVEKHLKIQLPEE